MCKYSIVNNYRGQSPLGECSHTSSGYLWESEPSWSFDIKAVTDIERILSEKPDSIPPFGWADLGIMARAVLDGGLLPVTATHQLREIRPHDEKWGEICEIISNRLECTRPSRRRPTLLVCLDLAQQWLNEPDDLFLQALDFNKIFIVRPDPAKPPTYLPSRTAILRSNRTRSKCAISSPRFHPAPDEFTFGRHDYEGLCEAMWAYTRATEFECWRTGRKSTNGNSILGKVEDQSPEPVI